MKRVPISISLYVVPAFSMKVSTSGVRILNYVGIGNLKHTVHTPATTVSSEHTDMT
jgi:hypothetical protein